VLTDTQADDLYELITERAGRSTIFTANRAPADWYPLYPNPVVAESLLDRLVNKQSRPAHGRTELPPPKAARSRVSQRQGGRP